MSSPRDGSRASASGAGPSTSRSFPTVRCSSRTTTRGRSTGSATPGRNSGQGEALRYNPVALGDSSPHPAAVRSGPFTNASAAAGVLFPVKAPATPGALRRAASLFDSTVGQKIVVALTGLILLGFVIVHMAGNLKVFEGPEAFDAYARFLREVGSPLVPRTGLLWCLRLILLAALVLHVVCIARLSAANRRARDVSYAESHDLSFSRASRLMLWGGVVLLAFVVYHLMHLTWGVVHPAFIEGAVHHNVITAFQVPWVPVVYAVALLALGLHVYHGLWSTTQTLAVRSPLVRKWRRPFSAALAAGLVIGYLLVPAAVVVGWLRLR